MRSKVGTPCAAFQQCLGFLSANVLHKDIDGYMCGTVCLCRVVLLVSLYRVNRDKCEGKAQISLRCTPEIPSSLARRYLRFVVIFKRLTFRPFRLYNRADYLAKLSTLITIISAETKKADTVFHIKAREKIRKNFPCPFTLLDAEALYNLSFKVIGIGACFFCAYVQYATDIKP